MDVRHLQIKNTDSHKIQDKSQFKIIFKNCLICRNNNKMYVNISKINDEMNERIIHFSSTN